jgi:hypothetical protein
VHSGPCKGSCACSMVVLVSIAHRGLRLPARTAASCERSGTRYAVVDRVARLVVVVDGEALDGLRSTVSSVEGAGVVEVPAGSGEDDASNEPNR